MKVTEYTTMNLGGWFPMRLLNMMIGVMMKKGMGELMKKLHKYQAEIDSRN